MTWTKQVSTYIVLPGDNLGVECLGGKALGLRRVGALGLPVPKWIVLTTSGTEALLQQIRHEIDALLALVDPVNPDAVAGVSTQIRDLLRGVTWPSQLRRDLFHAVSTLDGSGGLAVRSSAVTEDGVDASYAGQLDSLLAVNRFEVDLAICECIASAFGPRALAYRAERGTGADDIGVAIIVQEMLEARAAGVAFTADPVTGAPSRIITAAWGMGEGVVSDRVESDTYRRDAGARRWQSTIRKKSQRVVATSDCGGTCLTSVPAADQGRAVLSPEHLAQLDRLIDRLDASSDGPLDIEWALDTIGRLSILQVRPMTALPNGDLAVWDDANIGESYPGVTLPLTYSFVRLVYERVFARALRQAGVPSKTVADLRPRLRHLIGTVRGRLYMNVRVFYEMFAAVPGLGRSISSWEGAVGIQHASGGTALRVDARESWMTRRLRGCRTLVLLGYKLLTVRREAVSFQANVEAMLERYEQVPFDALSADELLRVHATIVDDHLDRWTLLIYNDLFAFTLDRLLAHWCGDDTEGKALHQRLLGGLQEVNSLAPLRSLRALADEARRSADISAIVRGGGDPKRAWDELLAAGSGAVFCEHLESHGSRYGHRTVEELKLEAVGLSEEPWALIPMVAAQMDRTGAVTKREENVTTRAAIAKDVLLARWPRLSPMRLIARVVLDKTRECIANRESMSYARSRAYELLRRLYRAAGRQLASSGAIKRADDVFYLTLPDLEAYVGGGFVGDDLSALVDLRRRQYVDLEAEAPASRIVCRGPMYRCVGSVTVAAPTSSTLQGFPSAPGVARGLARVLYTPTGTERVEGEILVAPVTEPGWVFLMTAAAGLVVERGSPLSHAAILGRELGIPTVVGVEGATSQIEDGDLIEVDGSTGRVQIIERKTERVA